MFLQAYVWDWTLSLAEEYKAFEKSRFRTPNIVYMVSRIGTIAYSVSVVSGALKKGQLNQWLFFVSWSFWEVSALGTYGLFFIRVCAVYRDSRAATWIFGFMYASIVLFPIFFILGIKHTSIIDMERFLETPAPFYDGVATILPAINDTVIFFSISLRLANNSFGHNNPMSRMRTFFTGHGLKSLSKTLLQSGQSYYGATILLSLISTGLMFSNNIRGSYGALLGPAHTAMSSAMACRVYRTVLLFSDDGDNHLDTQISDAFRGAIVEEFPLFTVANPAATRRESEDSCHREMAIQGTGKSSKVHEANQDSEA
ncbi:hypothetical protein FIBSPDRAFT_1044928 [Athelia psychrophila]|uniref:Uncharacterized protein n=1 Tax=Athelia psychrophila TaxID=1759441 RepID=A0A166IXT6_9AGAM|nr:hypothetical protein FIBSPDRAFT_1044928 [Fibularhizoctonia sp. CBS 109695]